MAVFLLPWQLLAAAGVRGCFDRDFYHFDAVKGKRKDPVLMVVEELFRIERVKGTIFPEWIRQEAPHRWERESKIISTILAKAFHGLERGNAVDSIPDFMQR